MSLNISAPQEKQNALYEWFINLYRNFRKIGNFKPGKNTVVPAAGLEPATY